MALALNPEMPQDFLEKLIVVDMSPARGPISGEYKEYIQAMKAIEAKGAKNRREADVVLQQFEEVISEECHPWLHSSYPYRSGCHDSSIPPHQP